MQGAAEIRCVVCEGSLHDLGQRASFVYAACDSCGSVQLVPLPDESELERLYREEYHAAGHYDADPELSVRNRRRICRFVARRLAALYPKEDTRLVVELGAGWGTLGLALGEVGIPYLGLEPSEVMCAHAAGLGLQMINGGIERLEQDSELRSRIRAIVTMSVYEHLTDQVGVLRRMASLLPQDGAILIQAPTASLPRMVGRLMHRVIPNRELPSLLGFFAPPWHVCLPTPTGLRLQANRADLVLEAVDASPTGRYADWGRRSLQVLQEAVGRGGHRLLGERWPLSTAHVFLLRPKPAATI